MRGPLGAYGIAHSQLERIGYNPLEAQGPLEQALGGGGGGGFGFSLGGQRPYNDMERTILAHNYPGGFKVATDQYAAKYSDQLDEWAKEELKEKYPNRDWDAEYERTAALKDNFYNTGEFWGPKGSTGRTESTPVNVYKKKIAPVHKSPLASTRDRHGLSSVFSRNKQNKSAIANRPRSTSDMYSRFGRGR